MPNPSIFIMEVLMCRVNITSEINLFVYTENRYSFFCLSYQPTFIGRLWLLFGANSCNCCCQYHFGCVIAARARTFIFFTKNPIPISIHIVDLFKGHLICIVKHTYIMWYIKRKFFWFLISYLCEVCVCICFKWSLTFWSIKSRWLGFRQPSLLFLTFFLSSPLLLLLNFCFLSHSISGWISLYVFVSSTK